MKKKALNAGVSGKVPISDLILYSIFSVNSGKEICNFERLMGECYNLFPQSFCFTNYEKWPDSRKLDRPLRTLRKQQLIKGDPATFFFLTKAGQKKAEEVAKIFRQSQLFR